MSIEYILNIWSVAVAEKCYNLYAYDCKRLYKLWVLSCNTV